ncbi:MAG: phosphoribosyl-ATP diphosphatase [Elioraea sp.]|nr:phosphoribosyl-ATP diphosphatase [Elioraea sp.]
MAKRDKDRDKADKPGTQGRAVLASLDPLLAPPRLPDATVLDRLHATVLSRKGADPDVSHSARLLSRGTAKVAQKLGEEAVETVIEATRGNRAGLIAESADLLYHLIVVWVDAGVRPDEIWAELERRQGISGIAEKASRARALAHPPPARRLPKTSKLW